MKTIIDPKNIQAAARCSVAVPALLAAFMLLSCGGGSGSKSGGKTIIQNQGSDTMVNLAGAWAEEYRKVEPAVSVEVGGGGSGTGISSMINGLVDLANCSRAITKEEAKLMKDNTGKDPVEHVVGYDALAVYVHKDNPLNEISLEQLAQIYGKNGTFTKWSQLGIENKGCPSDEIILVSRQSSSGTFTYFREAILGKGDFRLGTKDLHGSKDVVELIGNSPCAIGYSGMGYATDEVKVLAISEKTGGTAYAPNVENTLSKTYPIARPLLMYTLGEEQGAVKAYLDWCYSDAGQKIVEQTGYVSLPADKRRN